MLYMSSLKFATRFPLFTKPPCRAWLTIWNLWKKGQLDSCGLGEIRKGSHFGTRYQIAVKKYIIWYNNHRKNLIPPVSFIIRKGATPQRKKWVKTYGSSGHGCVRFEGCWLSAGIWIYQAKNEIRINAERLTDRKWGCGYFSKVKNNY